MKRNSSKTAENSAKRRAGFTLVELVVVIAVLAILAGVGAVAYRGYIKKAYEAADMEQLAAIKTAAFAMFEENGDTCSLIKVTPTSTTGEVKKIEILPVGKDGKDDSTKMCTFIITDGNIKLSTGGTKEPSPGKDLYDTDSFIDYLSGNTFELKSEKFTKNEGGRQYYARWELKKNKWFSTK